MQYCVFDANVTKRWQRVKHFVEECTQVDFWTNIKHHVRELLRDTIGFCLEQEMIEYTNAQRHQRTDQRMDFRNGFYYRNLDTELGPLDRLKIPRSRQGLFKTKVFQLYQRRQQAVNQAITNVFLAGISTRNVSASLKPLLLSTFSASTVSRITKNLNTAVAAFHRRNIIDEYQFLFLDGITLSVKGALKAKKKLVLAAYGLTLFGKKELIAFRIARSESQASWESFLNDLYNRGLKGHNLKLIITDGCKGLHAALDTVYAYTKRQHCWVHKLRNAAKYIKKIDQKKALAQVKKIYNADSKRQAVRLFKTWKYHWQSLYPKAVACIERDLDELLAFLDIQIPKQYQKIIRRRIRTTNVIERAFREVRRRTRPMSCFTNEQSVNRIIYAIFTSLNAKWMDKPLKEFTQFI